MTNFKTILAFELKSFWRKPFIILSVLLIAIIAIFLSYPRFLPIFEELFSSDTEEDITNIAVTIEIPEEEEFLAFLQAALGEKEFHLEPVQLSMGELEEAINYGAYDRGIYISSLSNYSTVVADVELHDQTGEIIKSTIAAFASQSSLHSLGLSSDEIQASLYPIVSETVIQTGINQQDSFAYSYLLVIVLYFAIIMYGQQIAMNVATEKSSRAMEVLVTSVNPTTFIFAKVIASALAGFIQLSVLLGSAVLFFNINSKYWEDNYFIGSIFDVPPNLIVYMLFFFLTGFFIYAFLFGASGSIVSKVEDINIATLPVLLCFIGTFFISIIALNSGNLDSLLVKIASFFPLTSPMVMFTRISMTEVPLLEIGISALILIISTIFIGYLAAKIYRLGVLSYGNKASLFTFIKLVFNKK